MTTRIFGLAGLAATVILTCSCSARSRDGEPRHPVVSSASQVGSLYWQGQLTDHRGNRWNFTWIPGIVPTWRGAGEGFADGWEFTAPMGTGRYWRTQGAWIGDCMRWSGRDVLWDFGLAGVGRDWTETSDALVGVARDKPFGWVAQLAGRSLWGFVCVPAGRLALAPVGAACGVAVGVLRTPLESSGRIAVTAGYAGAMGVVVPVGKMAWHQPAWLLSLANAEPDPADSGAWGVSIVGNQGQSAAAQDTRIIGRDQVRSHARQRVELAAWRAQRDVLQRRRDELDRLLQESARNRPDSIPLGSHVVAAEGAIDAAQENEIRSWYAARVEALSPEERLSMPPVEELIDTLRCDLKAGAASSSR